MHSKAKKNKHLFGWGNASCPAPYLSVLSSDFVEKYENVIFIFLSFATPH